MKDYILDASAALLRNYADLPFDADTNPDTARRVNERALVALERSGEGYAYLVTADMLADRREELVRNRLLSRDAHESVCGAAYLRMDDLVCVETSGADHLRIAAYDAEGDVRRCLERCADLVRGMEDTGVMAYSERFGFLTREPCYTGSGMLVSMALHLPMSSQIQQAASALHISMITGGNLRVQDGGICLLENRVTLGRDGDAVLEQMQESARRLCALERSLRWKARERKDLNGADKAWRAYATARYALKISREEALKLWSSLVLGKAVTDMPCEEQTLDGLWRIAHMSPGKLKGDGSLHPDVARAMRIRALFGGGE